ncbi:hypothetical protein C0Q70_09661 [Pomacea canaliculata]|uniref:Uncharacterized protein n=1 Tax=Pomacea canaliculata TaxID=400727 RepID=A0A2T7PAE3_POMCA|nr:hypothetical protein C0Q70_09661 [Pomacea canaliculata]
MRQEKALSVDKFLPGSSQDWQYKKRVEEREAINTTWPSARHAPLLQRQAPDTTCSLYGDPASGQPGVVSPVFSTLLHVHPATVVT